jgi:hypothetical protein
MNAMKEIHLDEAFVEHVAATSLVTDACFLRDICLTTLQSQDLENVEASFQLVWKADATLTCLVAKPVLTKGKQRVQNPERAKWPSRQVLVARMKPHTGNRRSWRSKSHFKARRVCFSVLALRVLIHTPGHSVKGHIKLRKDVDNRRALDIEVVLHDGTTQHAQRWQLR